MLLFNKDRTQTEISEKILNGFCILVNGTF